MTLASKLRRGIPGIRRRTVAAATAIALAVATGIAFGPIQANEAAGCSDPATTGSSAQTAPAAAVAHRASPNELHRDWPVVSSSEQIRYDSQGRPYRTTIEIHVPPSAATTQTSATAQLSLGALVAFACAGSAGDIAPVLTAYSYDGAFAQHYELFFHRLWDNSLRYHVIQNYQTNVWWTRNYTSYDVYNGQTQNCWNMPAGFDCQDTSEYNNNALCSQLPFPNTIGWPGGTGDSDTFVYAGPMNTWPYLYRTSTAYPYSWSFTMTTQWSVNGTYIDTISDSYSPQL